MTDTSLLRKVAYETGEGRAEHRDQLTRFDWLFSAMEVLVTEGIDEVRITRLAENLSVTRGSFYWHFSNRRDLMDALVHYWKERNTPAIVDSVNGVGSLQEGIFNFFETCVDPDRFDPRLDLAIREWARRSDKIRLALDEADSIRVASICEFFKRFDYPMPEAFIRARVLYFAQIGFYALEVSEPLEVRLSYSAAYFKSFTGQTLAPGDEKVFSENIRNRFGGKL